MEAQSTIEKENPALVMNNDMKKEASSGEQWEEKKERRNTFSTILTSAYSVGASPSPKSLNTENSF